MRTGVRLVFKNTIANYVGTAVALLVALFLTPFILSRLGKEAFGIWILVGALGAYGDLLDLGIDSALTKYVAEHASTDNTPELERVVHTSFALYGVLGLIVVALTLVTAAVFPRLFHLPPELTLPSQLLVVITGTSLALNFPLAMYTGVLRGLQRHDVINATAIALHIGTASLVVLLLSRGGGLMAVGLVYAVGNTLNQLIRIVYLHVRYPGIRWIRLRIHRRQSGRILSFGAHSFVLRTSGMVAYKADEIVVGALTTLAAVSVYGIGLRVADLLRRFTAQLPMSVYPYASAVSATGEPDAIAGLYLAASRLSLAIAAPIAVFLCLQAPRFIQAWVGPGFADSVPITRLLILAALVSVSSEIGTTLVKSLGQHQRLARWSMAEAAGNLILSLVLIRWLGILGVAVGTLIPTLVYNLGFVYPHVSRRLHVRLRQTAAEVLLPQVLPAVTAIAVCLALARIAGSVTMLRVLAEAAITGAVYWSLFLGVGISAQERRAIRQALAPGRRRSEPPATDSDHNGATP